MKEIFRNNLISIKSTGKNYDIAYVIENLTDTRINIYLDDLDDYLEIMGNDWVGLLYREYSDEIVNNLIKEKYSWNYIYGAI